MVVDPTGYSTRYEVGIVRGKNRRGTKTGLALSNGAYGVISYQLIVMLPKPVEHDHLDPGRVTACPVACLGVASGRLLPNLCHS